MKGKNLIKRFSLLPQGLRYKLLIAFSLMSVIPLLIIGYLVNNFILLGTDVQLGQASVIMLLCIIIAWLGLFLAKRIIDRVIDIALETKIITDGNYERRVTADTGDEIGQIGEAINFLTKKIRSNISDLRDYQDKVKEINLDIQKRVSVLSNLLQIGELISSSVNIEDILELVLNKLSQLYEGGFAVLYFSEGPGKPFRLRASHNIENKDLLTVKIEEGKGLLGKAVARRKQVILDASSRFSSDDQKVKTIYKCENIVAYPMFITKEARALLAIGNSIKNFIYTNEDIGVIKVFAGQIAIAVENDILITKARKLEIKDERTGLFNKSYMMGRLKEEIQRAIIAQRPCSFIMMDVDDFKKYEKDKGQPQAEVAMKKIARLIAEFSMPPGKAGLIDGNTFALILPEVNKRGALETAEKVRKRIEKEELSSKKGDRLTASGGVSENPLDGSSADEIFSKAEGALKKAKKKGKNTILAAGA